MKLEHRAIIDRCKREHAYPAELAGELLEHDLVQLVLDQLRGQSVPYGKLSEKAMASAIERITEGVHSAVQMAIRVIAANGVKAVPIEVKRVQADEKSLTVTAKADSNDPRKHDLVDAAGHVCLLVMAPDDYSEALDDFVPDRDQTELPLSAADLAAGMGLNNQQEHQQPEQKPKQEQATDEPLSKEFGDYDYQEATRLLIAKAKAKAFKAHWIQSQLAISSDQVSTLLLRLLDDKMIVIEKEGESSTDHSYKIDRLLAEAS